jgi:hypothetical protein
MESTPHYIFFHICFINNWVDVVNKLFDKIKSSGLYDKVDGIYCGVLGDKNNLSHPLFSDPKVNMLYHSENMTFFERPTLYYLHELSKKSDFNVLYIHSKGIQHNGTNPCVEDWVDYLTYFNITRFQDCLKRLESSNVVGVNLQKEEYAEIYHFSGNFWWSKSSYIRKLNPNIDPSYTGPEYWITTGKDGMFSSLFNSYVNHYTDRFLPEQYVGHEIFGAKTS